MTAVDSSPDTLTDEAWDRLFRQLPRVPHGKRQPIPVMKIPPPAKRARCAGPVFGGDEVRS